jgi:hypothetical protein
MGKMLAGWLYFVMAVLLSTFAPANTQSAIAKDVLIKVPDLIQIESGVESPFPIEVTSKDGEASRAIVLIRGIPTSASLTEGRLFPSGTWAIKPSALREVRLLTTSSTVEATTLNISLVTFEGRDLGAASTLLVIAPNIGMPRAVAVVAVPRAADPPNTAAPPPLNPGKPPMLNAPETAPRAASQGETEKIGQLLERGDRNLLEGKIAFARRFYQLAAEMGSPVGAEAVARTYDADYLRRFPIVGGGFPDNNMAQTWYNKAKELTQNAKVNNQDSGSKN